MEKTGILSTKIDIVLAIIRLGLFFDDKLLVKKSVERATTLVESGGDWVSVACYTPGQELIGSGSSKSSQVLPGLTPHDYPRSQSGW